jgi:hypothetical protein
MLKINLHRFFRFTCNGKYSQKDIKRVISKINTASGLGPKGDCWEWTGSLDNDGYGQITISKNGKYKIHRVVQEMATNKTITEGKCVMHKCDNPKCVKVFIHLILGTHQDNMTDKVNKGRAIGNYVDSEDSSNSKHTWKEISDIRMLWLTGKYTQKQLADKFITCRQNISDIINNKIWYDSNYIPNKFIDHKKKLTDEQIDEIRNLNITGNYTQKQLGNIFGVTQSCIGSILNNKKRIRKVG